ncbi:MAG: SLC13/DASS family transporter [Clostridia bacterium]|nr:SLC13/DASS family transporter [Clostridia bacterium]
MSQITIVLVLLVFAMVMFVWNKIPVAATAMIIPPALILTGILKPAEAFSGFTNSNVLLFAAMFIVGGALFSTGMAHKIGGLVTRFAKTERQLILGVMLVSGLLSSVLSNTGTAAVLMPVVIGIAAKSGFKPSRLLMPLIFGATIGGCITLLGSAGNLTVSATLESVTGQGLGFFDFTVIGLPILIVGTVFFYFFGHKLLPDREPNDDSYSVSEDFSHVPAWKQYLSLGVLLAVVVGMVFEKQIGVPMYVVAIIGALVLVVSGVITEKQACGFLNMPTIFLVAGMLPMAVALNNTGAGALIAETVVKVFGGGASPILIMACLWILTNVITQFMSNSAAVAILSPIGISIAAQLGADPTAVLMSILVAGSCAFCTPIAQPQNTMVYGPGGYKFSDYFKAGFPLTIVCFVMCMILLPIFFPFY